jgi:hypothetical protein
LYVFGSIGRSIDEMIGLGLYVIDRRMMMNNKGLRYSKHEFPYSRWGFFTLFHAIF